MPFVPPKSIPAKAGPQREHPGGPGAKDKAARLAKVAGGDDPAAPDEKEDDVAVEKVLLPPLGELRQNGVFAEGLARFARSRCVYKCLECPGGGDRGGGDDGDLVAEEVNLAGRVKFFTHVYQEHNMTVSEYK